MRTGRRRPGPGSRLVFVVPVATLMAVSACAPQIGVPGAETVAATPSALSASSPSDPAAVTPGPVMEVSAAGVGYLVFNAVITRDSRDLFIADLDKLRAAGARDIHLGINSPGGEVNAARDMVSYMARLRGDGVTVQAYNIGQVASAASYLFLNAQGRYSVPQGQFVFHAPFAAGNIVANADQLRAEATQLESFESTMHDLLRRRTHLTDAEADTYVRRTVVLNADDARRDGIVDGVRPFAVPQGVEIWTIGPQRAVSGVGAPAVRPVVTPGPSS